VAWTLQSPSCTTHDPLLVPDYETHVSAAGAEWGRDRFMKHLATRSFFQYWDDKRGRAAAPDRSDFEPGDVRELLGDIFVLSHDQAAGHPFRVAGTRVCALLGGDAKGQSFTGLFSAGSRLEIEEILNIVTCEALPAVCGISARSVKGSLAHLELLLLPFNAKTHTPLSLTGLLVPLQTATDQMTDFNLDSWRYVAARPDARPRALRRWTAANSFTVYEGIEAPLNTNR